jgi:hypothetical protein
MFIGHFALGLAAKRVNPRVSLAAWFMAVQLADLIWPLMLLLGLEHVRIAPGITAFTPLDFYDYPITHSLVGAIAWAALFGGLSFLKRRYRPHDQHDAGIVSILFAIAVVSHWVLDVIAHRPDMPVLPHGPYVGLNLWRSRPATLAIELTMFAIGLALYVRAGAAGARRPSFWLLIAFLLAVYFAAAFGPPPPSVTVLAWSGLAGWLLIPWVRWADRP